MSVPFETAFSGVQAGFPTLANSATIAAQNAGRSPGLRLVTRPWSATTSRSTQVPPALRMSVAREGKEGRARPHICLDQRPGAMADPPGGLARSEDAPQEADGGRVAAQLVRADGAARHDDGVVVVRGHLVESLVDGKGLAGIEVMVDGTGRPGLRADHVDVGPGLRHGLPGLGELGLLGSGRSEQDRDLSGA